MATRVAVLWAVLVMVGCGSDFETKEALSHDGGTGGTGSTAGTGGDAGGEADSAPPLHGLGEECGVQSECGDPEIPASVGWRCISGTCTVVCSTGGTLHCETSGGYCVTAGPYYDLCVWTDGG